MTDITELAQSLKAAAEKATPGCWEYYPGNTSIEYNVDSMDKDQGSIVYVDSGDFTQAQTDRNGEFIAMANPVNVLALVEALEKAQHRIAELEEAEQKLC
ncbi:ead/Ea22-like family protein, partial [Klebsiella pneumoniae]